MDTGVWLSITEYQNLKNMSVSTIRRYIKANRVKWKLENKRYFIFVTTEKYSLLQSNDLLGSNLGKNDLEYKLEIQRLKYKIQKIESEKYDLEMLVNLYEGTNTKKDNKLELPNIPLGQ